MAGKCWEKIATPCTAHFTGGDDLYMNSERNEGRMLDGSFPIFEDENNTASIELTAEIKYPLLASAKQRKPRNLREFKVNENSGGISKLGAQKGTQTQIARPQVMRKASSSMLSRPTGKLTCNRSSLLGGVCQNYGSLHNLQRRNLSLSPRDRDASAKNPPFMRKKQDLGINKDRGHETRPVSSYDIAMTTTFVTFNSTKNPTDVEKKILTHHNLSPNLHGQRQSRKSLTGFPKRVPLQQAVNIPQMFATSRDVVRQGDGKENIPPGAMVTCNNHLDNMNLPMVTQKTFSSRSIGRPKQVSQDRSKSTRKDAERVATRSKHVTERIASNNDRKQKENKQTCRSIKIQKK